MNMVNTIRLWQPVVPEAHGIILEDGVKNRAVDPRQSHYELVEARFLPQPLDLDRRRGLHELGPRSSRYILGMLAQTQRRYRILGLTTYFGGGHPGLFQAIQGCFGPVRALLWGGELLLKNMHSKPSVGMVMQVNETSGFLQRHVLTRGLRVDNSLANLMDPLQQGDLPLRVSRVVRANPFDPAHPHLHPGVARMPGNFRHSLMGKFMVMSHPLEAIEGGEDLATISHHFRHWIETVHFIKTFCDLLITNDPGQARNFRELSRLLGKILRGHRLSRDEYETIPPAVKNLSSHYVKKIREDQGNEYDLFVV